MGILPLPVHDSLPIQQVLDLSRFFILHLHGDLPCIFLMPTRDHLSLHFYYQFCTGELKFFQPGTFYAFSTSQVLPENQSSPSRPGTSYMSFYMSISTGEPK